MSGAELSMIVVFGMATMFGIIWVYCRHHRSVGAPQDEVPHEVREKSHQVKNEVMAVRGPLRRIAQSHDPLSELARAIRRGADREE